MFFTVTKRNAIHKCIEAAKADTCTQTHHTCVGMGTVS